MRKKRTGTRGGDGGGERGREVDWRINEDRDVAASEKEKDDRRAREGRRDVEREPQ